MKQRTLCFSRLFLILLLTVAALVKVSAQSTITVTGKVLDEKNQPFYGATISEKGTTNAVPSDMDGNFTLKNVNSTGALVVTVMGYKTQEIAVNNKTEFSIKLEEDTYLLDDVVVVGYGVQRKSDLTGAVSSIKPEDALMAVPTGNITDALQGRMSGVSILSGSGDPSQENTIRIRGMNSMSGDAGPLVVIDGFIGGSLQTLNPSDIASIEVLKDASATAVYGSRGANGVILVTTKSPKKDTTISFNSFVSMKTIAKKPDRLSPYETAMLSNQYSQEYNGVAKTYYDATELEAFKNGTAGYDYFDKIINDPAMSQNYELSLASGGEKTSVLASVRYNKTEGIIEENYKETYNYRLKVDTKAKSWLNLGLNFSGHYSYDKGPRLSQYNGVLLAAMYFPNTINPISTTGQDKYVNKVPLNGNNIYNPMGHIWESQNKNTRLYNSLQGYADFKILDGLNFRSQLGVDFTNRRNSSYDNENSYFNFSERNTRGISRSYDTRYWLNTNILSYVKEFNKDHRINATAVYEQSYDTNYWHESLAKGLDSDILGENSLGGGAKGLAEVKSEKSVNTLQSWMFRANYVFKNKYMLTASMRGDGTSRLKQKWSYFPSAALAWDIKQESFMQDVDMLSQFKFRVGYGSVGNQAIEAYRRFDQIKAEQGVYMKGRPQGDNLKWERNNQTNIGIDAGFWNGRLTVNLDWYKKVSKDILLEVAKPAHMGYTSQLENAGEIENQGLEATISIDPISTKEWSWHTDVTMTYNKGKFTKIPTRDRTQILGEGKYQDGIMKIIEGRKIATFWGYKYLGVWQQADIDAPFIGADGQPNGKTNGQEYDVRAGQARYEDKDKNGKYSEDDQGEIGSGQPVFNWGWNNTFRYKDFDLSLFVVGFHGFDIYNATEQIGFNLIGSQQVDNITPMKKMRNRWTPTNTNTNVPSFEKEARPSKNMFSSRFVEKGDFIKMKSITLGYTLPASLSNKLQINNLRVYASVLNPFIITSYSGMDPESSLGSPLTQGVDWGSYPNSRDFILGLNFSF